MCPILGDRHPGAGAEAGAGVVGGIGKQGASQGNLFPSLHRKNSYQFFVQVSQSSQVEVWIKASDQESLKGVIQPIPKVAVI